MKTFKAYLRQCDEDCAADDYEVGTLHKTSVSAKICPKCKVIKVIVGKAGENIIKSLE